MGGQYDTTIGTLLIGIFFNTYLYGLVTYQFAAYYRTKFNDRPAIKCMVLFLFLLDTFHSASAIYMAWTYTVTNFDNPAALADAEWPYTFTPIGTALAALVTQIFLGYRIWRLSSSKYLYAIVIVLAIPSFALGMACGIRAWMIKVLSELPSITPMVIAWLAMQVVVDAFITGTLIIILSRSRTGFRKTDTVLNRLIRGAIQTGLFAGIFSMGDLITFVALPTTNLYGMFAIPIGRIYTNTLLDTLLTREELKSQMAGTYEVGSASGQIGWAPSDTAAASTVHSANIQLQIHKSVQEISDRSSFEADGKTTLAI
ncbi:hypothetical protein HYDPIDRAFT_136040 [Hydnomerulius pinastri MD-312]|uniref:DUF6534 domain-containing protein n=1 Tax=Hydnomerulius pinastri MD-312 TaxID=994086 RepID=A0A0C9V9L6_9AGAM|nr:hypothetical protein HYDPIDRAFT_136040 [Hydnomerulius pinastri MD-312]